MVQAQPAADLIWGPAPVQFALHEQAQRLVGDELVLSRTAPLSLRGMIGALRQIAALIVAVSVELPFHCGGASAQLDGDLADRAAQSKQIGDLQPLTQR